MVQVITDCLTHSHSIPISGEKTAAGHPLTFQGWRNLGIHTVDCDQFLEQHQWPAWVSYNKAFPRDRLKTIIVFTVLETSYTGTRRLEPEHPPDDPSQPNCAPLGTAFGSSPHKLTPSILATLTKALNQDMNVQFVQVNPCPESAALVNFARHTSGTGSVLEPDFNPPTGPRSSFTMGTLQRVGIKDMGNRHCNTLLFPPNLSVPT